MILCLALLPINFLYSVENQNNDDYQVYLFYDSGNRFFQTKNTLTV